MLKAKKESKVAILMPVGGTGGVQRVVVNLANGLSNLGQSVDVICCDARMGLPGLSDKVTVIDFKKKWQHGDFKVLFSGPRVAKILRTGAYNCLLTAPGFSGQVGVAAARAAHVPVIVLIDNKLSLLNDSSLKHRLSYGSALRIYPKANAIVTAHDSALADLHDCFSGRECNARIVRIYHPIIPDDVGVKRAEPATLVKDEHRPTVVAAGRLVEEKDFRTLVRAFAVVRSCRDCRLVILGEGPDRPEIEHLVAELGLQSDVFLPGQTDNVYAYFSRSKVYVLSSRQEAFGNVLVEALACGLRCVATECASGGPQEILANGSYGRLVPIGDSQAMADAILAQLDCQEDNSARLQARGMEFSVENSTEAYMQLIEEVSR